MRLGLSTVLTAALAVGLMACSSSTGDGAGGAGGSGSGGGDTTSQGGGDTTSQGGGDTTSQGGGDTTSVGGGGGAGGGTTDGECVVENVAIVDDEVACDADCDAALPGTSGEFAMCTITCDPAGDGSDCGTELVCAETTDGGGICVYSCADGASCPGASEFVCDQETLVCDPDGASE
jgi:hypothetical protein